MSNCKVIAVANQKGGVGKTTTTLSLGVALSNLGKKVLLIDADPQADLSTCMGYYDTDNIPNIATLMKSTMNNNKINIGDIILHHNENIDLIPSNIELAELTLLLGNVKYREDIMKQSLEELKSKYDYILIDCMPSLDIITINALSFAKEVIIPVQAQYLSVKATGYLIRTIFNINKEINPDLKICGLLPTMVDNRTTFSAKVIEILKDIFWDMHSISFEIKKEVNEVNEVESQDLERNILYILISSKTVNEMIEQYNFSTLQKEQIGELSKNEYASLWAAPIYGTHIGSPSIVQIALQEVGNVGGEKYWSWYGFSSRVEWCAIFISWIANEAGYINSNVIPRFSGVGNGIDWFKALGQWETSNYLPKTGDIIFFDWESDGKANHVGIVERVENDYIYTVEGNSSNDTCSQKKYKIGSKVIYGYGTPYY